VATGVKNREPRKECVREGKQIKPLHADVKEAKMRQRHGNVIE
jgi:hypothetical protein